MRNIFVHKLFETIYKENPIVLIDIGASGGIPQEWKRASKYLKVIGFEPDERAFANLKNNNNYKFINAALGLSEQEVDFYLTKKQETSSVFYPNADLLKQFPDHERYSVVKTKRIKTKPLTKSMIRGKDIGDADFIKLDTQGGELTILKGAVNLLDDCIFGIETEVEFAPIYLKQPLFSDMNSFLLEKGFHLFDLKRYYWKRKIGAEARLCKGQIIFADALYLKTYDALKHILEKMEEKDKKPKVMKAISICLVYGLCDYALYLSDMACKDNFLSLAENNLIHKKIYKKQIKIPFFFCGPIQYLFYRISRLIYLIYKYIRTATFCFSDDEIGN